MPDVEVLRSSVRSGRYCECSQGPHCDGFHDEQDHQGIPDTFDFLILQSKPTMAPIRSVLFVALAAVSMVCALPLADGALVGSVQKAPSFPDVYGRASTVAPSGSADASVDGDASVSAEGGADMDAEGSASVSGGASGGLEGDMTGGVAGDMSGSLGGAGDLTGEVDGAGEIGGAGEVTGELGGAGNVAGEAGGAVGMAGGAGGKLTGGAKGSGGLIGRFIGFANGSA
ncbi:hypothetical protein VNI00_008751 [Paramarasmius palmivorus]|uniref:Uncharacterized protein n=1 Tax=Paramarasmius palmivorus TaxID=297713 RepID=A0AAW0CVV0_9AGAR